MNRKLSNILVLLSVSGTFLTINVLAQNQQFLPNVENNIQNDVNARAVNPYQAQQLQNKAAAIQNQEMRDMSKHGGTLTPEEQRRINQETSQLNKQTYKDIRMNQGATLNPNWQPPGAQNPNWQQRQQWLQNHPNAQQELRQHKRWAQQHGQ